MHVQLNAHIFRPNSFVFNVQGLTTHFECSRKLFQRTCNWTQFFNALKAPMEKYCPYSNKPGPYGFSYIMVCWSIKSYTNLNTRPLNALGIELPFLALAVETTKPTLGAAVCFWATKVLLVTHTSFLVYKRRVVLTIRQTFEVEVKWVSLQLVGSSPSCSLEILGPSSPFCRWKISKMPQKKQVEKNPFSLKTPNFYFYFSEESATAVCLLNTVLMVLYKCRLWNLSVDAGQFGCITKLKTKRLVLEGYFEGVIISNLKRALV